MAFRSTLVLFSQKSKSKSASWVSRQSRDPYVKKRVADPASYRARSAFKLIEINDHQDIGQFLDHADVRAVVDLGAAPGGWSQVVAGKFGWGTDLLETATSTPEEEDPHEDQDEPSTKWKRKRVDRRKLPKAELSHFDPLNISELSSPDPSATPGRGTIVAVDLLPVAPIPGVQTIRGDFMLDSTTQLIQSLLRSQDNPQGKADIILSDMAANASGNTAHDIQSSLEICETVFEFAKWNLRTADSIGRKRGGVLLIKFFAHPLLEQFRTEKLEPNFNSVHFIKPDSSRSASREGYFLCQGWEP